jgi:hypothetical protein
MSIEAAKSVLDSVRLQAPSTKGINIVFIVVAFAFDIAGDDCNNCLLEIFLQCTICCVTLMAQRRYSIELSGHSVAASVSRWSLMRHACWAQPAIPQQHHAASQVF